MYFTSISNLSFQNQKGPSKLSAFRAFLSQSTTGYDVLCIYNVCCMLYTVQNKQDA